MLLNKEAYQYLAFRLKIYTALNLLGIVAVYFLIASEAVWVEKRSEAVLIPEFKYTYPMLQYMAASTKEMEEAKLYTFIEQYIKRTQDERLVYYHLPTNMKRSDAGFLKTSLLEAVEMSRGVAKKENLEKYKDSSDTYTLLKQCKCGWIFNIHAIESIQRTPHHDTVVVSVLGEFQKTYDQVQADLPHEFWSYKRIWLTIVQGRPSEDSSGNPKNPYGLYVTAQDMQSLDYSKKDLLFQQVYDKGYFIF